MADAGGKALYPISAVSEMTGVNPSTLRAWERRHGLLEPRRSEGGRRLYTAEDVRRVRRIRASLAGGVTLSRVAAAIDSEADRRELDAAGWPRLREEAVAAVSRFDEGGLDALYGRVLAVHSFAEVTDSLTVPLLETLGRRWETGEGLVAEEHFFQTYVRNVLGARFVHRVRAGHGKALVAACIPGERHDLGLLLFSLAAEAEGFRVINLGADSPLAELPRVAAACGASAIVLAANYTAIDPALAQALRRLARGAHGPVVLVGGRRVETDGAQLEEAGVQLLGIDIRAAIRRLRTLLESAAVAPRA